MTHEAGLLSALRQAFPGVQVDAFEPGSTPEVVSRGCSARIIIGPHGTNLTNHSWRRGLAHCPSCRATAHVKGRFMTETVTLIKVDDGLRAPSCRPRGKGSVGGYKPKRHWGTNQAFERLTRENSKRPGGPARVDDEPKVADLAPPPSWRARRRAGPTLR